MRNTKTEYVSCPSCGRTLFDLQEVTDQIRQKTGHLPGMGKLADSSLLVHTYQNPPFLFLSFASKGILIV